VENFVYPNFIWKEGALEHRNVPTRWYLFNGKDSIDLGKKLPKEHKTLEYQSNVSPDTIVQLIMNKKIKSREIEREMIERG